MWTSTPPPAWFSTSEFAAAAVLRLEPQVVTLMFAKYMGDDQNAWDPRFLPSVHCEEDVPMIRITPDTVVVREQSYTLAR